MKLILLRGGPLALLLLGACTAQTVDRKAPLEPEVTETGALECSLAARERYLDRARAAGLQVEGSGEDASVVATKPDQVPVVEDLYARQLAELEACTG
ncbi:MAG: hypothetical protein AAF415_16250 [Pseudomonadota bacterium]